MSNYNTLKSAIQAAIKTNGNNEITGQILQDKLLSMIATLGFGYQFMGIAFPNAYPGTPDAKVFYIAYQPGTYTYMGGISVTGLCVLKYDTTWIKEDIQIAGGGGADFITEPDDLTLETGGETNLLKFADRQYNVGTPNGLGYKILRKDLSFSEQVTGANTIYEIRYDFDLNNETVQIPNNCFFRFSGGSVFNGTLSGGLLNRIFDVANFGVVYNDQTKAASNGSRLAVISGITTPLSLFVSSEMWLSGSKITLSSPRLSLLSNKNASIHLLNFGGFEVKNIYANGLNVDSSGTTTLFIIPSFVGSGSFVMDNCQCSGDIRVLTVNQTATTEEYNISLFTVKNCIFENFYRSTASNVIFYCENVIIKRGVIQNNIFHNSPSLVFHCGVTNDSAYQSVVINSKREFLIADNLYYNDLDYKPWLNESLPAAGTYMCLVVLEYGKCLVRNNVFRNILYEKENSVATYDNYLSVNNLVYENNIWDDCGNLSGYLTVLMKSKTGANGRRVYRNNVYTLTDLSTALETTDKRGTTAPLIFETDSTFDYVEMSGNRFTMSGVYCNCYDRWQIKNFVFKDNKIDAESFVKPTAAPALFALSGTIEKWLFDNNEVKLTGQASGMLSFIGQSVAYDGGDVTILNNKLIGFSSLVYTNNTTQYSGRIIAENNSLDLGNTTAGTTFNAMLFLGIFPDLIAKNNIFKNSGNRVVVVDSCKSDFECELKFFHNLSNLTLYATRPGSNFTEGKIYNIVVDVNGVKSELNVKRVSSSNIEYVCYSDVGVLQINPTSTFRIYATNGSYTSMISNGLSLGNLVKQNAINEIKIKVKEITNINRLTIIPGAVATADRPTLIAADAGKNLYDKTLAKPIWWTGTSWVDATGATV